MKQMAGIKKRKLEYVLNAIVYCMWYYRVKFQEFSIPSAIKIGTILARCIHSAEHMENEHPKYVKRERKKMNDFWYDKENGLNINIVYDNFMWACGFNGLAVALPILAVLARLCRDLSFLSSTVLTYLLVCVFICIIVGVIVAERMVFRKKRYHNCPLKMDGVKN